MELDTATQIAEDYVSRLTGDKLRLVLYPRKTIERYFGWVFFYGPSDSSIKVAGNAPFIVDRKDGDIHSTGTAFPVERYLESYDRVGRTYPFAIAEHLVILEGWMPGMLKVSFTKLVHGSAGKSLAGAKYCTDEVLAGKPVALTFATSADADAFCADAQQLGVLSKRETRFR
jgi:hypothetical protein